MVRVKHRQSSSLIIDQETGANIAVSYKKEDAKLIAHAPELLECLRALVDVSIDNPDMLHRARMDAERAIRNATEG